MNFHICLHGIFLTFLCLCLIIGCGKTTDKETVEVNAGVASTANEVVISGDVSTDINRKPTELDKAVEAHIQKILKETPGLEEAEAPIQMTYFFIRAIQMENAEAVQGMLTQDAYHELVTRQGSKLPCPDFIRDSEVILGNVQYISETDEAEAEEGSEDVEVEGKIVGARVGTIWKVKTEEGEWEENIAWVFRFEDDTWLVAGMISVVDPALPPILFNFENLADTEAEFEAREQAISQMNAEKAAADAKMETEVNSNEIITNENGDENESSKTNISEIAEEIAEEMGEVREENSLALPTELP